MGRNFHTRFNQLFEESYLSQEEFGKLFNATKGQIYRWRSGSGEPNTVMLAKISKICSVSVDWLIGTSDTRRHTDVIEPNETSDKSRDFPEEVATSIIETVIGELQKLVSKKK